MKEGYKKMRTIMDELPKRPSNRKGGNTVKQIPIDYTRTETKIEKLAHLICRSLNNQIKINYKY